MATIPQAHIEPGVHNRITAAFFDVIIGERREGPPTVPEALESMLPCAL